MSVLHDGWRDGGVDFEAIARRYARVALDAGLADAPVAVPEGPWEISLALAGDADIRPLNRKWRGRDQATDVLSFPAHDGSVQDGHSARQMPGGTPEPLGDIMLAWETVARDAVADGRPAGDHAAHLVVHGVLHLLGYDHETETEARAMEALETAVLAAAGLANPYAEPAE